MNNLCSRTVKMNYPDVVSIDKQKLMTNDTESIVSLAFALNPIGFEKKMSELGIKMVNYLEDIKSLSKLHDMNGDLDGLLVDCNNKKVKFDLIDTIEDIDVDNAKSNTIKLEIK